MTYDVTRVRDWKPAREFPETYPGDHPAGSYLILNDHVYPLLFEDPLDLESGYIVDAGYGHMQVRSLLADFGLPSMGERYPSLAYGANRNPGTLYIKFLNYEYRSPGEGLAVPVMKGRLRGADVVAGGLSGQGYLYGDLIVESDHSKDTIIEAWVALLDEDQLRVINDSEGIDGGDYVLAQFPGFKFEGIEHAIAPLGYAGSFPIFVSPALGKPLSFATVEAENRSLPAMTPREMLTHLLDVFDIRRSVSQWTGIAEDGNMAAELTKYMNGQWWYQFHTGNPPISGYQRLIGTMKELMRENSESANTAKLKRGLGLAIPLEESYHPQASMTLRGLIG